MIVSLVNGINYKNKKILFESLSYFIMIIAFSVEILTTPLIENYAIYFTGLYINFGLIYLFYYLVW